MPHFIEHIETLIDQNEVVDLNILREEEAMTIVHCSYFAKHYYENGGWLSIWPTTYLVHQATNERLELLHVVNAPLSPRKHYFKQKGERLNFSLLFGQLPAHWGQFDLIEQAGDGAGFQFHGIQRNSTGVYRITVD